MPKEPELTLDFAIIGAGAAGTYAAWRLAHAPGIKAAQIGVFDYSIIEDQPHVGGRLWSTQLAGLGFVRQAEFGGMRYLSSQTIVNSLLKKLGVPSVQFDVESRNNLFYLRGQVLRSTALFEPALVPYRLTANEQGMTPGGLLLYAIESIVPNAPYLTSVEWQEVKCSFKVDGCSLYNMGFLELLQRVLSDEAYNYVYDGQGYDTILTNWNAADAMEWMFEDFGAGVAYQYVHAGYQTLPKTLLEQAQDQGVQFHSPWKLESWDFDNAGVVLQFDQGRTVRAKNLILAMPRRSLELLRMPDNPALATMLPAVNPEPMFKFFVGYKYPWWRALGLKSGRTVTELPLRQIYYWGSNYDQFFVKADVKTRGVPNRPEHSMIMCYLDGRDAYFWKPLFELLKRHKGEPFGVLGPKKIASPKYRQLIETIQQQLRTTHGITYIPQPYTLAYADWTADPLGGGWNSWNPGYKSWEVTRNIIRPYAGHSVYICGEAYSTKQGWVEGAFETAEQMLRTYLGLQQPDWLPTDYKFS